MNLKYQKHMLHLFSTYLLALDIYMPNTAKSVLQIRNWSKSHKEKNGRMKQLDKS